MSREYAEGRIREALKLHKGNATKARQQITAWTFEDPKLLQALARPHLTGIIAYAVDRVINHSGEEQAEEPQIPDMPQALNMAPDTFGREILKALSSNNTSVFGRENIVPSGRKQASQSHIDAMKNIAKKKKDDR
jgi:hypothetical protein